MLGFERARGGVGEPPGAVRLQDHHRRLQGFERDPQELLLVAQGGFPLLHLLVHRAHRVEYLGEVGLRRPAQRLQGLPVDQLARQSHELAQRAAETLLDAGGEHQRQQRREEGAGEQPVDRAEVGGAARGVGEEEVEQQAAPLEVDRGDRDHQVPPPVHRGVVASEQVRREGLRQRQRRQGAGADQIGTRDRRERRAVPQRDLAAPAGGQPFRELVVDREAAAEVHRGVAGGAQGLDGARLLVPCLLAGDALVEKKGQDHQRKDDAARDQEAQPAAEGRDLLAADDRGEGDQRADQGPQCGDGRAHDPIRGGRPVGDGDHEPLSLAPNPGQPALAVHHEPRPPTAGVEELSRADRVEAFDLRMEGRRDLAGAREHRMPDGPRARPIRGQARPPVAQPPPRFGGDPELDGPALGLVQRPAPFDAHRGARGSEVAPDRGDPILIVEQQQLRRRRPLHQAPALGQHRRHVVQPTVRSIGRQQPRGLQVVSRQRDLGPVPPGSRELHRHSGEEGRETEQREERGEIQATVQAPGAPAPRRPAAAQPRQRQHPHAAPAGLQEVQRQPLEGLARSRRDRRDDRGDHQGADEQARPGGRQHGCPAPCRGAPEQDRHAEKNSRRRRCAQCHRERPQRDNQPRDPSFESQRQQGQQQPAEPAPDALSARGIEQERHHNLDPGAARNPDPLGALLVLPDADPPPRRRPHAPDPASLQRGVVGDDHRAHEAPLQQERFPQPQVGAPDRPLHPPLALAERPHPARKRVALAAPGEHVAAVVGEVDRAPLDAPRRAVEQRERQRRVDRLAGGTQEANQGLLRGHRFGGPHHSAAVLFEIGARRPFGGPAATRPDRDRQRHRRRRPRQPPASARPGEQQQSAPQSDQRRRGGRKARPRSTGRHRRQGQQPRPQLGDSTRRFLHLVEYSLAPVLIVRTLNVSMLEP